MYAEIQAKGSIFKDGIYKVLEICGNIVAVEYEGRTVDFYINRGEVKRFCTVDGHNYRKEFKNAEMLALEKFPVSPQKRKIFLEGWNAGINKS